MPTQLLAPPTFLLKIDSTEQYKVSTNVVIDMDRKLWLKLCGGIAKLKTHVDIRNYMDENKKQLQKRLKLGDWDELLAKMILKYRQGVCFDTYYPVL